MAVAHSAASESHTGTTGSTNQASFSWTHTQTGTPQGVLVFVHTISATDTVTSVTYGGTGLTRVDGGAAIDSAGEPGRTDLFFLGSGLASGNQTITVNRTNNATVMYASAATVTAATDTNTTGIVLLQGDGTMAVQSVTDGGAPTDSLRYAGAYSGLASPPPAGTGSTLLTSIDFGQYGCALVRETTAGTGARNVGFNSATDDRAAVHVAVRELWNRTDTQTVGSFTLTGNDVNFARGRVFLAGSATVNTLSGSEELDGRTTKNILSVTTNAGLSPFGTQNAELITEDTATVAHYIQFEVALASGTFTASCYYKSNGRGFAYLYVSDTSSGVCGLAYVNLSTGEATLSTGSSASAVDAGNGWWRLAVTGVANGNINGVRIGLANSNTSVNYVGNGTAGIYAWGAQVVHTSEAGEYKRTPATFVFERPSATLAHKQALTADPVSFALTGNDVTLIKPQALTIAADTGAFFLPERNMRRWSESFDNAAWTKTRSSITANATTAPDGSLTADALIEDSSASTTHFTQQSITFVKGRIYTASCYFKLYPGATTRYARLWLGDLITFSVNLYIDINLDTGTILSISGSTLDNGVTDVGNGWYRAWLTRAYSGAGTTRNVSISVVTTAGLDAYTGDGLSGIYIWGAQYEEGYISDYDRTGPAAATRADTLKGFNTVGGTGSFTLTGNDASLSKFAPANLQAVVGSIALTGNDATLAEGGTQNLNLSADAGVFALTGNDATLRHSYSLVADAGVFTAAGPPATLRHNPKIDGARGAFALTGGNPALLRGRYLSGGAGTFTETGQPATFRRTRAIQGGTGAFSLTGYPAALTEINAYQINALVGAFSLTGNAAQLARSRRFSVVAGDFSFTGQAAGLRQAYALTADRGQFALTGGSPSLTWSRRSTFNPGSFSLTGNPAALLHATTLTGETGAFALTGLVAELAKQSARELAVNTGLFSLTGRSATLKRALLFGVSSGSFTLGSPSPVLQRGCVTTGGRGEFLLSGQPAELLKAYVLNASMGAFDLTGQSANLTDTDELYPAAGAFSLSGQDAGLARSRTMPVTAGVFSLSGQAAALLEGRGLTAERGTFSLSGQQNTLRQGYLLSGAAGSFSLTGNAAGLSKQTARELLGGVGAFSATGQAASLIRTHRLAGVTGSFAASGQPATLRQNWTLTGGRGLFSLTGGQPTLRVGRRAFANTGVFTLTGQSAQLTSASRLVAGGASFSLTGHAASLTVSGTITRRRNVLIF